MEEFDAKYRSCRRSLARHQERRKQRNALQGSYRKKSQQSQQYQPEQQAQQMQQGEPDIAAQPPLAQLFVPELLPQLLPLPLPSPAQLDQPKQVAAFKLPDPPAKRYRRQAAGSQAANPAERAPAASSPPCTEDPLAKQLLLQPEESSSGVHSCPPEQPQLLGAAQPAASLARQSDAVQPVTPPGQPGSQAARSLPPEQPPAAWAPMCAPTYAAPRAPPPQHALYQLVQPAQPAPAAAAAWGQQAPERSWVLVVGDQRLVVPAPPPRPPSHAVQQLGGQAIWLVQHAQPDLGGSSGGTGTGSGSGGSGTTHFPCYEPGVVQGLLRVHAPLAAEPPAFRHFTEVAACSASTAAAPLSPCMPAAAHTLQSYGSGVSSAYMSATPLSPPAGGGSSSAPPHSPCRAAGTASLPGRPAFWVTASLPAGPALLPGAPPPEGCSGSSNSLSQAWAQLARQEQEQMALLAAASPHAAAPPSLPPGLLSPEASMQPYPPPSPHAVLQPSLHAAAPPSLPPGWQPGPSLARLPSLPLARLPSLPPPQAPSSCQQAWQQQGDWADEVLIASQPACPQSPAVSWLNGF